MGKVSVVIVDATGNKEQKVGLPDDIKIGIIMVKLVEKIKLPSTGPDGNPISYKFIHKVTGRQLLETQTLADAHIKDGDVLRLQPEITAGAVCPKCGNELQEGVSFCTSCGQPLSAVPQQNFTQPAYTPYAVASKNKFDLVKTLGFIGAGCYMGSGVLDNVLDNVSYRLFNVLQHVGVGLFMIAIVYYMLHKMEK